VIQQTDTFSPVTKRSRTARLVFLRDSREINQREVERSLIPEDISTNLDKVGGPANYIYIYMDRS